MHDHPHVGSSTNESLRLGLLYNSRSGRHRRTWTQHGLPAGVPAFEANTPQQMRAALQQMAAQDIQLLAIAGGDGTVQACLSELLLQPCFQRLPLLAIIPTGSTNMTGGDVGRVPIKRRGWQPLLDFAAQPEALEQHCTERAVLRIQHGGEPFCGMFFGSGAIHHAVEHTQRNYHQLGLRGDTGPGLAFLRFAKAVASNNLGQLSPVQARIQASHGVRLEQGNVLLLATTLHRLLLNFRPYWGREGGPIHWSAVADDATGFLARILAVARGNDKKLSQSDGYHSHNGQRLELLFDGGFIVDGEFHRARREDGPVVLDIAGTPRFLQL